MTITKTIYTLGLSCIAVGLFLGFISFKEYKQPETKPISYERSCAIEVLYFEGRNISKKEQEAILDIVINRTKHKNYPSTICGVVKQAFQFAYRNNFSTNANLIPKFQDINQFDRKAYLEIEKIVDNRLVQGKIKPNKVVGTNALHYHTYKSEPTWSKDKKHKRIHIDSNFKHRYYAFVG